MNFRSLWRHAYSEISILRERVVSLERLFFRGNEVNVSSLCMLAFWDYSFESSLNWNILPPCTSKIDVNFRLLLYSRFQLALENAKYWISLGWFYSSEPCAFHTLRVEILLTTVFLVDKSRFPSHKLSHKTWNIMLFTVRFVRKITEIFRLCSYGIPRSGIRKLTHTECRKRLSFCCFNSQ